MTTICPLGPSAVSPITSLLNNFSDEITNMIPTKIPITQ
jgi:NADH:ubiquinone oxidoreductase subunit F (NADH-binding)